MLLQQLIAQQQARYVQIQEQIDKLQEQQRQIQAFMQQLGSVESKMVSAVQQVQEAIASINEVCPDELDNFALEVNNLFGKPVGILIPGADTDNDGDDDPTPTPPAPQTLSDEELEAIVPEIIDVSVETIEVLTPSGVDLPPTVSPIEQIKILVAKMSNSSIKEVLASYHLNTKGKQMALKERFIEFCEQQSTVEVQKIYEDLIGDNQIPSAA